MDRKEYAMTYLTNSFSLQMLESLPAVPIIDAVLPEEIPVDAISCVGHADTAAVLSGILGREVQCNRQSITIARGDTLYVAQLTGGRLPEGATQLPKGFTLTFMKVRVLYKDSLCTYPDESAGRTVVCPHLTPCADNCSKIC